MSERSGRGKLWVCGIIVALAVVYLIGNDRVALWDRDEPRYAQTSREMLASGDWVVPRFLGEVRTAKPIFIYWCQAGAMSVLGDNSFSARLPSVVGVVLTLILVGTVVGRGVGWEHALWTVIVLATSALLIAWCARNALTDGMLLLWITIAQVCLYRAWSRGSLSWSDVIIWGAALGLAGLTKGPIVLGIQATTLLALVAMHLLSPLPVLRERVRVRAVLLKIVAGVAIVALVAGPWLYLVHQREPDFLRTTINRDVVQRAIEPMEKHAGPPGYYLAAIWGTFLPWSLFLPMGLIFAWRHRAEPRIRFAFAAVVGPWLMCEIIQTKLPHYVLPVFPPLAFLTADALVRCFRGEEDDMIRPSFLIGATIWAVAVLAMGLAPWLVVRWFTPIPLAATIAWSIVAIAYAVTVFALFVGEKPKAAAGAMAIGMIVAMVIALGWYLPQAWFMRLPIRVANVLERDGATAPGEVQMIGYKEPSLAFYQGGTIREQREDDFLLTHPPSEWPMWIVIRGDLWEKVPQATKGQFDVLDVLKGWSYADKGRIRDVVILRKRS
jgi:4-amino-4-deoxy-L-arabinose transferase-like glycosyltransferase